MKAPAQRRTFRVISSLGLLITMAMLSRDLRAERCCCIRLPEVRFQNNSAIPVEGDLDLGCVIRRMNADSTLSEIAMILGDNPTITMLLVGHTDSDESDAQRLSLLRAQRMACELVSTYGIEAGRLTIEGKGSSQPRINERELDRMSRNERVHGRQANRRVEFSVMSFDWVPPQLDGIAAARFLSDPPSPKFSSTSFCDEPVASVEVLDTQAVLESQDTTLIAVEEPAALFTENPSVQMGTLAPMIVPNPIVNDVLSLVWLPATAQGLSIRMMASDGRFVLERVITRVEQGARLSLPVPASLAPGAYILRIGSGTQAWSLRFVKP